MLGFCFSDDKERMVSEYDKTYWYFFNGIIGDDFFALCSALPNSGEKLEADHHTPQW
jgi:hypothetical protein